MHPTPLFLYSNMNLPCLDQIFILKNYIQQIELDIDASEELKQIPISPMKGAILGHTGQWF